MIETIFMGRLGYELTKEPRDIIATKVKKDVKQ